MEVSFVGYLLAIHSGWSLTGESSSGFSRHFCTSNSSKSHRVVFGSTAIRFGYIGRYFISFWANFANHCYYSESAILEAKEHEVIEMQWNAQPTAAPSFGGRLRCLPSPISGVKPSVNINCAYNICLQLTPFPLRLRLRYKRLRRCAPCGFAIN